MAKYKFPQKRTPEEDAFILKHYKIDMTIAQIAALLKLTTSQVSSRYHILIKISKLDEKVDDKEEIESEFFVKRQNKITLPYVRMEHIDCEK